MLLIVKKTTSRNCRNFNERKSIHLTKDLLIRRRKKTQSQCRKTYQLMDHNLRGHLNN